MTQAFTDMIYLFSCGAMNIEPMMDHDIDVYEIYNQAQSQSVWHIVLLALNRLYDKGQLNIESKAFNRFKQETMIAVGTNTKKNFMVYNLIQKLENAGIKCCVLKGETLSVLYYNPSCRISCDTDILIDVKHKNKAIKLLNKNGFDINPFGETSLHIVALHPDTGIVELHLHLYDEIFEDVWFNNKMLNQEDIRIIKSDDGKYIPTLGITDGLIFVTLHYIKHFLSRGVGIRQLLDVLLYMKNYYNQIDWIRYNDLMQYLKYQKFIDNSIGIGVNYLNFNKEDIPIFNCDKSIMNEILNDIESGGIFGKNECEREGFYMQYTKARFNRFKHEDYQAYIKKWLHHSLFRKVFPSTLNLAQKFPYLKKRSILYPIAWVNRIIKIVILFFRKEINVNNYINKLDDFSENDIIKQRMDLIRKLDMI